MSEERDPQRERQLHDRDMRTGKGAAAARIAQQHKWVEEQVSRAIDRGEFDDLPGAGKPIEGLGDQHDPDWWLKKLVEREKIAVLPLSVELRKEDAELDDRLDTVGFEAEVVRIVTDFNERVIAARYRPPEGPPLITMPRDVDETVAAWAERRAARRAAVQDSVEPAPRRRRWWQRRA
ncbi:DnaJ family domain-containing protein [Nocardioides sp. GXZ039]|uniref:DnaJ family domain-containing protein n=1 Tax=Nocardioides sp. GXZ039 TaxID=3136018 RepID=UPI0030F4626B